jgi:hypothetical protein
MNAIAHTLMQIRGELRVPHFGPQHLGRRYSTDKSACSDAARAVAEARIVERQTWLAQALNKLPDVFGHADAQKLIERSKRKTSSQTVIKQLLRQDCIVLAQKGQPGRPSTYRKTGTQPSQPELTVLIPPASLADRITVSESGCWLWTGEMNRNGYGRVRSDGKRVMAHRRAWELLRGPIPTGLVLDHLCRNRHCCNPAHLEPVTVRENTLRGEAVLFQPQSPAIAITA